MKNNTRNKPEQNTMKHINILLSVGLLLLLSNCGSNWDLLNQAAETEEQSAQKRESFTHRQQTPEGAELIFSYEASKGLQAAYQTSTMPRPQAVSEYPVLHDAAGSPMRMSKLGQEEAYLLSTAGRWKVSEAGALRYRGMRGEGGMLRACCGAESSSVMREEEQAGDRGGRVNPSGSSSGSRVIARERRKVDFSLTDAEEVEVSDVQQHYMQNPYEDHEIKSVQRIQNETMQTAYNSQVDLLEARSESPVFSPKWRAGESTEVALRQKVNERLMAYVASGKLTLRLDGAKELKLWHGTSKAAAGGIMRGGFASLATRDDGFYGRGLYFSPQAGYVCRTYKPEVLLLCKVCFYSAYPVAMTSDIKTLYNRHNHENYSAHFIPVKKRKLPKEVYASLEPRQDYRSIPSDPDKKRNYPTDGEEAEADELVVFDTAQAMPLYLVNLQEGIPSSPVLLDKFRKLNLLDITREKLKNPGKVLSMEQSLEVLSNCLDMGEERSEEARGKDLVMFIGNTGSGKSTAINYLTGCDLERISKKKAGLEGTGKIVRVKEGSSKPELMRIGHSNVSETFLPDIKSDEVFTYCDCPGFLDNRGAEINIANAVNIKRAIGLARSVKVNVLINYNSLLADRGRGILETKKIMSDLFGNEERLKSQLESVLIGITQVPPPSAEDDEEDQMDIAQLRGDFRSDKLLHANSERIMTFDPLEKPIRGGLKRGEWIASIKGIPGIGHPSEIFSSVLLLTDERKLREIAQELNKRIGESLRTKDYKGVSKHLLMFNKLDRIEHAYVKGLRSEASQHITNQIHELRHGITLLMMGEDYEEAEKMLGDLDKMRQSLSKVPGCEFVESGYKEAKRFVDYSKKRKEERREQEERIRKMANDQEKISAQLSEMEKKQAESKRIEEKLESALERERSSNRAELSRLREEKVEELRKLEERMRASTEEERKELEKEKERQRREYEERLSKMEAKQAASEKQKERELAATKERMKQEEEERKRKEKELERLKKEAAKSKTSGGLLEVKRVLGKHYLGESAWAKLGVEVKEGDLPAVSEEMVSKVKAMQTKGEQPILVLDLGKSIEELEEKFKSKGKTLFSTRFGTDGKLRTESCYKEKEGGIRWVLLPGSDHGVLPGSRYKSYADQVKYMKEHYPGYEVGGARELLTLYMLHHMETGGYLFPEESYTWGRCKETYQVGDWGGKGWRIALGDSGLGGLVVHDDYGVYDHYHYGLFGFLSVSS